MNSTKFEKFTQTKAYLSNTVNYPPNMHDKIEIIYVVKGSGTATCNGKAYTVKEDRIFMVFPNQIHSYTDFNPSEDNEIYTISISPKCLSFDYEFLYKLQPESNLIFTEDYLILPLIKLMGHEFLFGNQEVLNMLVSALIKKILGYYTLVERKANSNNTEKILIYANENYKSNITLQKMSKDLYISANSLSKFFNNIIGMNFNDYINSLRLEFAVKEMIKKETSMADIALKAGFNSIRTFNRAFLKKYKTTPLQFIKNQSRD